MEPSELHPLIDRIYAAGLAPELWPEVLARFGAVFHGNVGAVLFMADSHGGGSETLGSPDRHDSIRDYVDHWADRTEAHRGRRVGTKPHVDIVRASAQLREGAVCIDDMVIDRAALTRTAFYQDHLVRFDYHHALGAKIWDGPSGSAVLSLSRGQRQGAFDRNDIRKLEALQPHLRRSLGLCERLAWSKVADTAGLEQAGCATFLLDQTGTCIHANATANALLAEFDGLDLVRGHLRAEDPATNNRVVRGIGLAVRGDAAGVRRADAVAVPRRSERPPWAMMIAPVGFDQDWLLPRRPRAVVTVIDPERRQAPAPEHLRALFNLTPSEASVAIGIGKGSALKDVAAEFGLTVDSARQYLTRIYAKTGTRRQNDLARLLATIGRV